MPLSGKAIRLQVPCEYSILALQRRDPACEATYITLPWDIEPKITAGAWAESGNLTICRFPKVSLNLCRARTAPTDSLHNQSIDDYRRHVCNEVARGEISGDLGLGCQVSARSYSCVRDK